MTYRLPEILLDVSGETYTIMRTRQYPGTVFHYEMREEFSGDPDSVVHYHDGSLHRFCPDGTKCGDQGKGLSIDPFNKVGRYTFIVYEEAVWDCISPKGAFPHRVQAELLEGSGTIGGDVYLSTGTWSIDGGPTLTSPQLINVPEDSEIEGEGVLFHHITTVPL